MACPSPALADLIVAEMHERDAFVQEARGRRLANSGSDWADLIAQRMRNLNAYETAGVSLPLLYPHEILRWQSTMRDRRLSEIKGEIARALDERRARENPTTRSEKIRTRVLRHPWMRCLAHLKCFALHTARMPLRPGPERGDKE